MVCFEVVPEEAEVLPEETEVLPVEEVLHVSEEPVIEMEEKEKQEAVVPE